MLKFFEKVTTRKVGKGFATIVAFGDSITQGSFSFQHPMTDINAVYHNKLKEKLTLYVRGPINMINAGVAGQRAVSALERMDRDVFSHNPDLVIVCFGLNDVNCGNKEEYLSSLRTIFTRLNDANIPSIFMTPNMMNTTVNKEIMPEKYYEMAERTAEIQNSGVMDDYMSCAIDVANECGITVCDCYGKWKQLAAAGVLTDRLLANGINHPIKEMHNLFAECLFYTILEMNSKA